MNCASILSNINLLKLWRLLDTNFINLHFTRLMRLVLLPNNWLNYHELGILWVTMCFYELIKCIHIRHCLLSKVSNHMQLVPIKRHLLILNVAHALRFKSTYCFYFERFPLFSYNFQQQLTLRIVDQPMWFSRLLLNPLITKIIPLKFIHFNESVLMTLVYEYFSLGIWYSDFCSIMVVLDISLRKLW